MTDLWKEVTTWLSEATKSAIKETEDLARRGRIKMEILGINTALNDKFTALGGVVYEIIRKGGRSSIKNNTKVKKLAIEIAELEARLARTKKMEEPVRKKKSDTTKKLTAKSQSIRKKPSARSKKTTASAKKRSTTKKKSTPASKQTG
jgi:hypothetical protein